MAKWPVPARVNNTNYHKLKTSFANILIMLVHAFKKASSKIRVSGFRWLGADGRQTSNGVRAPEGLKLGGH